MSVFRVSRAERGTMLSSLSALGASQPPVRTETVGRHQILGTLAAAGAALAAVSSAEASIVGANRDVRVGLGAGDAAVVRFDINSLENVPLNRAELAKGNLRGRNFPTGSAVFFKPSYRGGATKDAAELAYGKKFGTIAASIENASTRCDSVGGRTTGGLVVESNFSDQYCAFRFFDVWSQSHHGWLYGSSTGESRDRSHSPIPDAHETTVNEVITKGQGSVARPAMLVLGAMAALVLGAAGVREWMTDQAAKATAV